MRKTIRLANAVVIAVALAACAQPPSKGPVKNITPQQVIETNSAGDEVRWGGPILSIAPKQDETCFRMLSYFLGSNGQPHVQDQPQGHFLACAKGYYDPAVYAPRRLMTVVGTVGATQTVKVDNVEHKVASVDVQAVKLWPVPMKVLLYSDPWYIGPCCGPYLPGYPVYAPYAY
jgi:outer membrane lipoprotein